MASTRTRNLRYRGYMSGRKGTGCFTAATWVVWFRAWDIRAGTLEEESIVWCMEI